MPRLLSRTKDSADYDQLKRIGARLRSARQNANLTPREVAEALGGFSPNSVTCWEIGRMDPGVVTLGRMAQLYGVSVGVFYGEDIEDRPFTRGDMRRLMERLGVGGRK